MPWKGTNWSELGKKGFTASKGMWWELIEQACNRRDIDFDHGMFDLIIEKIFKNNRIVGGNIGYTTVDSYVGLLQATGQLPTPIRTRQIMYHRNRVNLSEKGGAVKKPDIERIFYGAPGTPSTQGTRLVPSRWNMM